MIGDRLKRFADTLPRNEKEALFALCEPNWGYEVVNIKIGEDGILMPIAFYHFNGRMAPLYTGKEIIWLQEIAPAGDPHTKCLRFPEQEAILKKYDALESKYSEIMKPFPWQMEIICGRIGDPKLWCQNWLIEHNPHYVYYPDALWEERSKILHYYRNVINQESATQYYATVLQKELQKELKMTKESVHEIQLQLKALEELKNGRRSKRERA